MSIIRFFLILLTTLLSFCTVVAFAEATSPEGKSTAIKMSSKNVMRQKASHSDETNNCSNIEYIYAKYNGDRISQRQFLIDSSYEKKPILRELDRQLINLDSKYKYKWLDTDLTEGFIPHYWNGNEKLEYALLMVTNFIRKYPNESISYVRAYKNTAYNYNTGALVQHGNIINVNNERIKNDTWISLETALSIPGLNVLKQNPDLYIISNRHSCSMSLTGKFTHNTLLPAIESGEKGDDPITRIQTLLSYETSNLSTLYAENILQYRYLGDKESFSSLPLPRYKIIALDNIIGYLLDFNQEDRGHRTNILNQELNLTGISCQLSNIVTNSYYTDIYCTSDFSS